MTSLLLICAVLAFIPVGQFLGNLFCYRPLPPQKGGPAGPPHHTVGAARPRSPSFNSPQGEPSGDSVSVLIPARNEEASIEAAVRSVLADPNPNLEVLVLDDHSSDGTAAIVQRLAAEDPSITLHHAPPLPAGWCGKQHACHVLSKLARHEWLLFMDADVRLAPAATPRMVAFVRRQQADLISGVPRQITGTFSEHLLIPLIHFVLLGYLPMPLMRLSRAPAFAAGCGQLFLVRREAYRIAGGHAGIRSSLHDGLKLPALFRAAGFRTDLFDATHEAVCRMYQSNAAVWSGLGKNATEGLGHPTRILPMTFLLVGGQVVPWLLLPWAWRAGDAWWRFSLLVIVLPLAIRLIAARRFRQSLLGALLHPLGVAALLWIQWRALFREWRGQPQTWRGRSYPPASTSTGGLPLAASAAAPHDRPPL